MTVSGPADADLMMSLQDYLTQQGATFVACAEFLRARGHRALPLSATVETLDKATLATPLPHKTTARLAGLGWIGKCALLITRSHGSAVRYNTVLTDAPLPAGMPADVSECGPCTACVDACPAGALLSRAWQPGMKREELLDALACCNDAQRRAAAFGMDNVICGICIAACPHTKRYVARSERTEAIQPDQEPEAP